MAMDFVAGIFQIFGILAFFALLIFISVVIGCLCSWFLDKLPEMLDDWYSKRRRNNG